MAVNYREMGLKIGLEIHQELATSHKLFCNCSPGLFREEPEYTFLRRLRPTQSELGEVDPASLFEFQQGKTILYEASRETNCLVEMDEEPPGPLNSDAVGICLILALMIGSRPVDEIHVMRKTVIDGSNTTGFQRTCVVALGGEINVDGKRIGIEQICLEEDAARKTGESGMLMQYRIDRLGIPLVEVSTAPVINSPEEAGSVALAIGRILRATGRVRRGLGSIRQDVNISLREGALMEIKGVQQLDLISKVVEYEVQRQRRLLDIHEELRKRGISKEDLREEFYDVTEVFSETRCQVIKSSTKKGGRVYALRLPHFTGLVGRELCPGRRLGTEMADRAKFWGGVSGIFHTDELPSYGITAEEVGKLRRAVEAEKEDAIIIVSSEPQRCKDALQAVLKRASEAVEGVPSETRGPNPDGTTHYMRPRPGAARMYPETDVVPVAIVPEWLERIRDSLPEMPEEKLSRLMRGFSLNRKLAMQLLDSDYLDLFEAIAKETKVSPSLVAVTLTETLKSLEREGVKIEALTEENLREVFFYLDKGSLVRESVPDVLTWIANNPGTTVLDAIKSLGLELLSQEEIWEIVRDKVKENEELAKHMGLRAVGPMMGAVMREVRGRARAEDVQGLLEKALRELLETHKGSH
jgi:glutamyl-tRNA(Gln) amidotransferase subunit E